MTTCQWFALCENETTRATDHPVLGIVPICERCAERMEIEPEHELEEDASIWEMAQAEWLRDPTPEHEKALNEAADTLRWKRQANYAAEGVTDALLRERFNEDEDEDI